MTFIRRLSASYRNGAQKLPVIVLLSCALGGCATVPKRPPSLIDTLQARIEQGSDDPAVYLDLASAHLDRQDYLRARQYHVLAERIVAMLPRDRPGTDRKLLQQRIFRLGVTIATRGQQYYDAIARCKEWLRQHEEPQVRELLAALYAAIDDMAAAERQHALLVEQDGKNTDHVLALARFYDTSTDPEKHKLAATFYERYLSLSPEGEEADAVRTRLLEQRLPNPTY